VEVCNNIDDDGDGLIDEYSPSNTGLCNGCTPVQYLDNTYWLCTGITRTWDNAEAYCEGLGGHLASVTTQNEQTAMQLNMLSVPSYWIGLNDKAQPGTWTWSDGTALTYSFFGCNTTTALPNNCANNCTRVTSNNGCWIDDNCVFGACLLGWTNPALSFVCKAPHVVTCK
jgi:hypothetical protein